MGTLTRRSFGLLALPAIAQSTGAFGQTGPSSRTVADFDQLLAQASSDQATVDQAKSYRELAYREDGPTPEALAAAPNLPRRYRSNKPISSRARDVIVRFEVSGERRYNAAYRKPIWPKGESGVTIGIGYDIGYCTRERLAEDWAGILSEASVASLGPACKVTGAAANGLLPFLQGIDVSWTAALQQFDRFVPFVAGETVHAFPRSEQLSADSFGALVSLVYNRGSAMNSRGSDSLDRRKEMRVVKELIAAGNYAEIAGQIRSMKRIWQGDPNARGLLDRRELEARLFEMGL